MTNETITDLRAHLFAVLAGLRDKDNPMDIERAKAISDVAQVVINSAKVEVDYMKIAGYPAAAPAFWIRHRRSCHRGLSASRRIGAGVVVSLVLTPAELVDLTARERPPCNIKDVPCER